MNEARQNIDTDQLFARYAKLRNASVVAKEFGVSRYQVTSWWNKLPETDRVKYEEQIEQARSNAIAEAATETKDEIIDTITKIAELRDSLLKKLSRSITILEDNDPATIPRIKDATVALKNIAEIEIIPPNNDADNFFAKLANQQKIYERQN